MSPKSVPAVTDRPAISAVRDLEDGDPELDETEVPAVGDGALEGPRAGVVTSGGGGGGTGGEGGLV